MNKSVPQYGGQAVIEGVMMRGRDRVAVAVRRPDGEVVVHEEHLSASTSELAKIPFLRGPLQLFEALTVGTRALAWSAQVNAGVSNPRYDDPTIGPATAALSLGLSSALMFAGPAAASSWIERRLGIQHSLTANVLEGALRIGVVAAYVTAVSMTYQGKRLFQYHGAEHKTINAYEAGAPLTPQSVRQYSLLHPRCGTAFLLTVAMINVLVNSFLGRPPFLLRVFSRILLLPLIAGLAYEFIRFSSQHMDNPAVRIIVTPNLWMQKLTTREPDLDMLEVSIQALEHILMQ